MNKLVNSPIGLLPSEWGCYQIKKIANVVRGSSPRPAGSPLYFNGNYLPWVTVADITSMNCKYLKTTSTKLTEEGAKLTRITPPGTLMLTNSGATLGVPAISQVRSGANDGIAMLLDLQDIDIEYAYYYLSSKTQYFRDVLAPGIGQPNLNTEIIGGLYIPVPPLCEQRKIVRILSVWDAAIDCVQRLLENSRQQKKALMQQLLTGKRRLPGFKGKWANRKIRDIATQITRQSDGNAYPILTITSMGGYVTQESKYRRYMAGESVNRYVLLKKREFAYNKGNSKTYEFGCVFPLQEFESGLVPHVYVCFKLHTGHDSLYYKYLFEHDYLKKQLAELVNTGVRNNGLLNIRPKEFMNTEVPVPPHEEQSAIGRLLSKCDQEISCYSSLLENYKSQKKALMQQILTGKRRVKPDPEDYEAE